MAGHYPESVAKSSDSLGFGPHVALLWKTRTLHAARGVIREIRGALPHTEDPIQVLEETTHEGFLTHEGRRSGPRSRTFRREKGG